MVKELIVTDVNWEDIPREYWERTIQEIPVGHCITRFPFDTWGNKRIKVALPQNLKVVNFVDVPLHTESHLTVTDESIILEYEQVALIDGTIVWERRS